MFKLIDALRQNLSERDAFALAHSDHILQSLFEAPNRGILGRLHFGVAAFRLDHLDHALDRKQPIDARRRTACTFGNIARDIQNRRQQILVDRAP